jgi:predicted Zn-dependent protease
MGSVVKNRCKINWICGLTRRLGVFLGLTLIFFQNTLSFAELPHARGFLGYLSINDERELGEQFNVLVHSRMPLILDPEVTSYAHNLLERLSVKMPPQPFPFKVNVIRHNSVNAFAVPGGYIYLYTGLILAMNNESELAGTLAHEMAHVSQRHIARRIAQSQKINLLSVIGMLAGVFLGGQVGEAAMFGTFAAGQSAMLKYSRTDEAEADQVGMNYLVAAEFRPQGLLEAFKILQRPQWNIGSDFPSYLSTHPAIAERITEVAARIESMPSGLKNRKENNAIFLRVQTLIRGRYGEPQAAQQFFEEQAKGPDKGLAYFGTALLYDRLNRVGEASLFFEKAMQNNPEEQLFIREAGRFHYLKMDKNRALILLQKAVAMNHKDYMGLFFYARLLNDNGQQHKAQDYYREILRALPEDAEVHHYYAQSLGQSRQLFLAHLHLAYSSLYENNKQKVEQYLGKARNLAQNTSEQRELEVFQQKYKERSFYWQ